MPHINQGARLCTILFRPNCSDRKSFKQAANDLAEAVSAGGFGILHIHDLGNTLRSKGIEFTEECQVFEVCNPGQAARVLANDMRLNMALPCRISVFTQNGKSMVGLIKPAEMLSSLSSDPQLIEVATEVEALTLKMVDRAT